MQKLSVAFRSEPEMKWLKSGIFLVVFLSSLWAAPTPFADDDGSLRLPKTSIPLHYDITLTTTVHLGQRAFNGIVKIEIEIVENTNLITLHNRGLEVQSATLKMENDTLVTVTISDDKAKEFLNIRSATRELLAGEKFTLELEYSGLLQLGTSGFYRSSYRVASVTRYLASIRLSWIIFNCKIFPIKISSSDTI